jgi:symplekin
MGDPTGTIKQLNAARDIVLKDAAIYPQVVPGVLPVISSCHPVELRRWGADFLAETFASPVLNAEEKQKLALGVLDTLRGYLARKEEVGEDEDEGVVKSAVQAASSIYPLVFRHVIGNADDGETWAKMAGIKSNILKRMDNAPGGVRMCCIKFVARVVQVQTPGVIADPRRGEQNEISLALVPREHKVLAPSILEAEASGLLDRLLGVLQENISDPLIATSTLNALSPLVQRRASISTKILSTVLNFNPLKLAERTLDGKEKVAVRSMTRTTMSFLLNILKRNPNHALAGRIQQQVERLRQRLTEVFSDVNPLKRGAPDEPIDGLSDEKRQRLDSEMEGGGTPQNVQYPTLPPGPVTVAQLFSLTPDQRASGFHVEAIPAQVASQLVPHLLTAVDQHRFDTAINVVKARFLELQRRSQPGQQGPDDGDDIYTPPDVGTPRGLQPVQTLQIQPFHLPPPKPLNEQEMVEFEETAKDRLFTALQRLEEESRRKDKKQNAEKENGFNRLASTSAQDRDGWICLLTRLATRTIPDNGEAKVKDEYAVQKRPSLDLPTRIREAFYKYIMDDWRPRIDIAIAWLNEEWYAERLQSPKSSTPSLPNYEKHTLRLLDSLLPYLDTKDGRYLTRLLSEIPQLPPAVFERVEKIALDPERVKLACDLLLYLVMLRPPVREVALDCAERLWRSNPDARAAAARVLGKWRPDVVKQSGGGGVKKEEAA